MRVFNDSSKFAAWAVERGWIKSKRKSVKSFIWDLINHWRARFYQNNEFKIKEDSERELTFLFQKFYFLYKMPTLYITRQLNWG